MGVLNLIREEFFRDHEFDGVPDAESAFDSCFRSGWDFYHYCIDD